MLILILPVFGIQNSWNAGTDQEQTGIQGESFDIDTDTVSEGTSGRRVPVGSNAGRVALYGSQA